MTLANGTGFIGMTLVLLHLLGSCTSAEPYVEPVRPVKERRLSLPEKCRPFYQDGTENWINCMGVGYK